MSSELTIDEQKKILFFILAAKTGYFVKVEYGEVWALGEWFYVNRRFLGPLRLGTTFESAKWFCEQVDLTLVTFD